MRRCIALLCWLGGAALAETRDRPVSLFHDAWPVVEASVAGAPLRLLVDTGTNHTLIDIGLARRRGWRLFDCRTVEGSMLGELCRVELPSLGLDGKRLPPLIGLAADMTRSDLGAALEVDGLLGGDLLSRYVLVVDFPHARWALLDPAQFQAPASPPISVDIDDFVVSVPLVLQGHAARFLLDTGNIGPPIVLRVAAEEHLVSPQALRTPNGIRSGAGGSADSVEGRANLEIGSRSWRDVRVLVAERPSSAGSVMAYRDGILGLQFLRAFRLTVDYPGRRIFLEQELPLPRASAWSLGMIARPRDGRLFVDGLARRGAAERGGVKIGDEILAVGEVAVSQLNAAVITRSLTPVAGQVITLTVKSGGAPARSVRLSGDELP